MIRFFKGIIVSVYRAIIGAVYGMFMWAPVGSLLLVGLVWRQSDLAGFPSELHVWVGLLALIGGFIGALVGVGGGVFSGLITGALIGYFGWLAIGDPAGMGESVTIRELADISFLVAIGTCVGVVGGLVGGLVTDIAGTGPAQGKGQVKAGVLLGVSSLLGFSLLTALLIRDADVVSQVIDFSLAGTGTPYAIPKPDLEPFTTFSGGIVAILAGTGLVALLPAVADEGRAAGKDGRAPAGFLRQMQLNLWRALLPLTLGLLCEVALTRAIGTLLGEARIGVGAVLGVGVANGIQEWIESHQDEENESRRRSSTVVWAAIIAAIVIAAVQGYLFPAM